MNVFRPTSEDLKCHYNINYRYIIILTYRLSILIQDEALTLFVYCNLTVFYRLLIAFQQKLIAVGQVGSTLLYVSI
jgi:hypothetical protein